MSGILIVFAHPDDESLSAGGALYHYAQKGIPTALLTFTDGQVGKHGFIGNMSRQEQAEFGAIRREELRQAAEILKIHELMTPGWQDGGLKDVDDEKGIAFVVNQIRRLKPDILISFGPEGGGNGHKDHKMTGRWAAGAFERAADPKYEPDTPAHEVKKYYWVTWSEEMAKVRNRTGSKITTVLDLGPESVEIKRRAFDCHKSQHYLTDIFNPLMVATAGQEHYHLAASRVGVSDTIEADLFERL